MDIFASDILSKKNQSLRTEISKLKFLIENNFKIKLELSFLVNILIVQFSHLFYGAKNIKFNKHSIDNLNKFQTKNSLIREL